MFEETHVGDCGGGAGLDVEADDVPSLILANVRALCQQASPEGVSPLTIIIIAPRME